MARPSASPTFAATLRRAWGLTVKEIAVIAGVAPHTWRGYESGRTMPATREAYLRLLDAGRAQGSGNPGEPALVHALQGAGVARGGCAGVEGRTLR